MIRYFTGGESHGKGLVAIVEGFPADLFIDLRYINASLTKRQMGYGRGNRMSIETDRIEILSGVRGGYTIGSPVTLFIENRDWQNWKDIMNPEKNADRKAVTLPRPGHVDLPGGMKYGHYDLRNVLERASARETAVRTAVGAVAKLLLMNLSVELFSYVIAIGKVRIARNILPMSTLGSSSLRRLSSIAAADEQGMNMPDAAAARKAVRAIEDAKKKGNTLGGVFEIRAANVPVGLGSYSQWDRKLDARLAGALMSIQAIKGVEIGCGMTNAERYGSEVHDAIFYSAKKGFYRKTNRAGGIEGGVTNGEEIILRGYMKPISTLYRPLHSVDVRSKSPGRAAVERSDICAVPAASVVGEAVVAIELANAVLEKFGGDTIGDLKHTYAAYRSRLQKY